MAAPGSQAGDASIRWTEEKYGILAAGDARLLSQERGLINWANKISESDRFDGAFLTPLGLYNESLYAHYITGDQYNDLVEGLYASGRIEHNYPKEYRSLALSPEEVRYWTELSPQLEAGLEASGFSVLGVKSTTVLGALQAVRHLGTAGDVVGLALVASQAHELNKRGQAEEADLLWASYFGELAGGAVGAAAGIAAAGFAISLTGVGAPVGAAMILTGALLGGYLGGSVGSAITKELVDDINKIINDGSIVDVDVVLDLIDPKLN
ncbi:MAG: hypothetical protein AAFQ87_21780, partial [Bacteroidota bacterium]